MFGQKASDQKVTESITSPSLYIHKAKCIKQPEFFIFDEAEKEIELIWIFENSGDQAWPKDTRFGMVNGCKDITIPQFISDQKLEPKK